MTTRPDPLSADDYDMLGHSIRLRSNAPTVLNHVRDVYRRFHTARWADGEAAPSSSRDGTAPFRIDVHDEIARSGLVRVRSRLHEFDLRCRDIRTFEEPTYCAPGKLAEPLPLFQWLMLDAVSRLDPELLLIHAGSVAWEGRALILPGASGAGKTTLTLKLAQSGFDFLSDEAACLRFGTDVVEPFPRRLNLSDASREMLDIETAPGARAHVNGSGEREWMLDADDVPGVRRGQSAHLTWIVFLRGLGETSRLAPLTPTAALFDVFKNELAPRGEAGGRMIRYAATLGGVRCHQLVVGAPDEAAELLRAMVVEDCLPCGDGR